MTVTSPQGFRAAGVAAGLKSSGGLDVALVVNDGPAYAAAGVFTRNRVRAAPVLWCEQILTTGLLRAVVLNSGGANACTGPEGFADTHHTAEHVAGELGMGAIDVAVASTGLIGLRLPMPELRSGITAAVKELSAEGGPNAAEAIMTTDSVPKQASLTRDGFTVGGMAKGAGMLAPGLATMLVLVTTDADADAETLDAALRQASALTFDRVDSDGAMSTNDTVLLLASGASGLTPDSTTLTQAVTEVCADLAHQLLSDAEGSTKDISITVELAATLDDALSVARAIARNNLVKCAFFGADPNWGRILAAVGTTEAAFQPDRLDVVINGVEVCRAGGIGEDRDTCDLSGRDVDVRVRLHAGDREATVWTNDLSLSYVHENSAYSS
ncbi:MAG: bifunctional glutamate N-acetyltransferase/amino-acid acetyltransferase ArgJ [Geodermatophilaceae bacterium]|nr:bifunctional glutamate N-acetyltransferase/amino-acid acetyltransferase ArgJ [Geodermatophilaceae bacterium]